MKIEFSPCYRPCTSRTWKQREKGGATVSLEAVKELYNSSVNLDPDQIYWSHWPGHAAVADAVREFGVAVFPSYLEESVVEKLNDEFDHILEEHKGDNGPFRTDTYDNLFNVRVLRDEISDQVLPTVCEVFSSPELEAVATSFFGDEAYSYNNAIFVTDVWETKVAQPFPPFALHFDKLNLFKCYYYLQDTDETNGAMRGSPGTNKLNKAVRLKAINSGMSGNVPNVPPIDIPSLPLSGPQGLSSFSIQICAMAQGQFNPIKDGARCGGILCLTARFTLLRTPTRPAGMMKIISSSSNALFWRFQSMDAHHCN